jgi:hypothetical protein
MPILILETPPVASGAKFNDLTASWIEVVAGLKKKVFDNVFYRVQPTLESFSF